VSVATQIYYARFDEAFFKLPPAARRRRYVNVEPGSLAELSLIRLDYAGRR